MLQDALQAWSMMLQQSIWMDLTSIEALSNVVGQHTPHMSLEVH